jgi:hypothetical protein
MVPFDQRPPDSGVILPHEVTIGGHYHHHAHARAGVPPPPHQPLVHSRSSRAPTSEPWLAAQNLTFLKRGSPSSSEKTAKRGSGGNTGNQQPAVVASRTASMDSNGLEVGSMPSLASALSRETSPAEHHHAKRDAASPPSAAKSDAGVSSLLMAAYAMTEFSGTPPDEESGLVKPKKKTGVGAANGAFEPPSVTKRRRTDMMTAA